MTAPGLGRAAQRRELGRHVVLGCCAGIGFTMAIFVAELGLPPETLGVGKLAILLATVTPRSWAWLELLADGWSKDGEALEPR